MAVEQEAGDPPQPVDQFVDRHIGPGESELAEMLATVGARSLEELTDSTIPADIRLRQPLNIGRARTEHEALRDLRALAGENRVARSLIGMGYYDTTTPAAILRNILENPGWYTQYTPYQAEISQGRLEALLNFQTMVADLTGLPLANASLLDEATAAAEAMHMAHAVCENERHSFFMAKGCHPQTIAVVQTRAKALGIEVVIGCPRSTDFSSGEHFGVLLQYPNTFGAVRDYREVVQKIHVSGALVVVATDLLALTLLTPPGEWGADIAIGNSQRFGVPLGCGGPHAAFMATRDEFKRQMPGRIIGVSKDVHGRPAYRLAIQTREQHIRREKATSNICTAQVLLAVMASMYAVYHGPGRLREIAKRVHALTALLHRGLEKLGVEVEFATFFDTIRVRPRKEPASSVLATALASGFNLRDYGDGWIGISLDETSDLAEVRKLWRAFGDDGKSAFDPQRDSAALDAEPDFGAATRKSSFLTHPVFNTHHSEHELLRYIKRLEARDLSLTTSMIPLGSCTMKLNAAAEMLPVSWPEFSRMHPFAPAEQTRGYARLITDLQKWLGEITGLPAVSLQPNSGAQGEYAGLLAIRAFHEKNAAINAPATERGGDAGASQPQPKTQHPATTMPRDVCLIPVSAHGTNPASAVMAGFKVVAVACDNQGNIDIADLKAKAAANAERLGALMVTYPSTHGVFEAGIREICQIVHQYGGQVYMDGANMNAQVGLCRPGDIGADVCHLNLHKTFCIPHGGGGPGMGPIAVAAHLAAFLPGNPLRDADRRADAGGTVGGAAPQSKGHNAAFAPGPVSAAAHGSASILPIPWMYIAMMGGSGLMKATQVAILNANYMARRLEAHYPILYRGQNGRVAHEFILDCRPFEDSAGVKVEDIAKRLMDYGFHAPTMSFPVPGTLMIEPTESEPRAELDRLCDALISIRNEIRDIEQGRADRSDNVLKNAPHCAAAVVSTKWSHPYTREQAAYPAAWTREHKFWPPVGRIDNVWGDRNLFCTCLPMENAPGAAGSTTAQ